MDKIQKLIDLADDPWNGYYHSRESVLNVIKDARPELEEIVKLKKEQDRKRKEQIRRDFIYNWNEGEKSFYACHMKNPTHCILGKLEKLALDIYLNNLYCSLEYRNVSCPTFKDIKVFFDDSVDHCIIFGAS